MSWQSLHNNSYVPYSKIPKACIVQGSKGGFYKGVRIENISFPLTISAIQAACCICLSEGEQPKTLFINKDKYPQIDFWAEEFQLKIKITDTPLVGSFQPLLKQAIHNEKQLLKELLPKAITAHSGFPVSALLYTNAGYFEGVNIEVSDWSLGLCAERVALAKAISEGAIEFKELAVHTKYGEVSSPCGACRQVIIEHLPYHKIRLRHADDSLTEHFTVDLLPFSFVSNTLKN